MNLRSALRCFRTVVAVFVLLVGTKSFSTTVADDPPSPLAAKKPMMTVWGEQLKADNVWPEYPRPQMERDNWLNLNGLWQYSVTAKNADKPDHWEGEILVPFAIEAPLSKVGRRLQANEALWYRRNLAVTKHGGKRTLLHFEAVDYSSRVWVNGILVGTNIGGSLPFHFDVTDAVQTGQNELVVKVLDATDEAGTFQLRGKQTQDLGRRIFYTPVSGIWQTVWLEQVSASHIKQFKIDTELSGQITIRPEIAGAGTIRCTAYFDGTEVATGTDSLTIKSPKLWSTDTPHLYQLKIELIDSKGTVLDTVRSYTGIRKVGKVQDKDGNWRFTLNGKVIFHLGPLDQGWWPDGLLTPPSEEAMLFDMKYLKAAGFNMIRKHIKVEPRRYYYHCDRMGFLVWQDQVSGGKSQKNGEWPGWKRLREYKKDNAPKGDQLDGDWPDWAHRQYMAELKGMIDSLYNNPSIVVWTPFNERWGQHRTMEVGKWIVNYDSTRSINIASGGNLFPIGDIADEHSYPDPYFWLENSAYDSYVKVVGEYGGHGFPVEGHLWRTDKKSWGYGGLPKNAEEYRERYINSLRILSELKSKGIAAGVYTQTTDVEGEINGLMTYDRKVIKLPAKDLKAIHQKMGF